jgi:hypothetical protein
MNTFIHLQDLKSKPKNSKKTVAYTSTLKMEGKKKAKAIPVRGREGPYVCETSRLPHFI